MIDHSKTITHVPEEECSKLIGMPSTSNAIISGDWVQIKKGHYKGDIAFVTAVKDDVCVLVVPRIVYDLCPAWTRAPPALFDVDRARAIFGLDAIRQVNSGKTYIFQKMTFKASLLEQVLGTKQWTSEDVSPTLEEIQLFSQSSGWDRGARDAWEANRADAALCERDHIQILTGEFQGAQGIIVSKHTDSVQIQLSHHNGLSDDFRLELSVDQV
jgi:transcription elongation factor